MLQQVFLLIFLSETPLTIKKGISLLKPEEQKGLHNVLASGVENTIKEADKCHDAGTPALKYTFVLLKEGNRISFTKHSNRTKQKKSINQIPK